MPFILSLYPFGSKDSIFVYGKPQLEVKFERVMSAPRVTNMRREPLPRGLPCTLPSCVPSALAIHPGPVSSAFFTESDTPQKWPSHTG